MSLSVKWFVTQQQTARTPEMPKQHVEAHPVTV